MVSSGTNRNRVTSFLRIHCRILRLLYFVCARVLKIFSPNPAVVTINYCRARRSGVGTEARGEKTQLIKNVNGRGTYTYS